MASTRRLASLALLLVVTPVLHVGCARVAEPTVTGKAEPVPLPVPIDELRCPLPARAPLPQQPHVTGVLVLARTELAKCVRACGDLEVTAALQAHPDGTVGRPTFVAPVDACFREPEIDACVARVWSELCVEPSRDGLASKLFLISAKPGLLWQPQPIFRVPPRFPMSAALNRVTGDVRVRFDIDTAGNVHNIEVLSSRPEGVFDDSAKTAVKRWRYEVPIGHDGQPTWARGQIVRMPFRLSN